MAGGKSTLLRIVAGLEMPDSGTVEIDGQDVTNVPARDRGIGFCFQHYAPFRHLTVRRNVAFGLEVRKRPKAEINAKVDELLDLVKIDHLADRYPSQLSGGQRQRMALARALAIEPELLLLDEPFGALDAQVRQELRVWLRELHEKISVTTVLVTHDQEEAMEVADRLAIINHGRLEQIGRPVGDVRQPGQRVRDEVPRAGHRARRRSGCAPTTWSSIGTRASGATPGTVERITHLGLRGPGGRHLGPGRDHLGPAEPGCGIRAPSDSERPGLGHPYEHPRRPAGAHRRDQLRSGPGGVNNACRCLTESSRVYISAKVDYAVRALCTLADADGRPVTAEALAQSQGLPAKFLESILNDMRRAGLLLSQRGAEGGYRLSRQAASITVAEVIRPARRPLGRGPRPAARGGQLRGIGRTPPGGMDRGAGQPASGARAGHHRRHRLRQPAQVGQKLITDPDSWLSR